jgi:hypothetical protein
MVTSFSLSPATLAEYKGYRSAWVLERTASCGLSKALNTRTVPARPPREYRVIF